MFMLTIALGNAAMLSPADVADALIAVAARLRAGGGDLTEGRVLDANGNSVGGWQMVPA